MKPRLLFEGMRFVSTTTDEEKAKAMVGNPHCEANASKPFGVHISRIDPTTGEVLEWAKEDGFSVWVSV